MAEQKSRLVVEIDSRNSKKVAQELNKELKNLESSGDIASKGVTKVGEAAESQTPKLNQMKTGITKLAQEVKLGFAGMAGTIVGTIGSSLTIGAIAALAVQTANTAAEIERLAYLSGTTTTEFQEWAVGARAMGIEMDKLSDIFKDTRDRVGDFISTGGGELADFFTEIATKTEGGAKGALELAKTMRELSGPQALQLYVDKLKEAGVSQNEMVYYMESVADEATSLIPLLENGGEGFQLWAEAARNAGAIMDDEALAAAQRLKVETELLQMQINGLKNQFMQALLPALNQIAGAFLATSEQGVQFNGVSESVANTLIWLSKVGMGVAATFDIIGKTIGGAIAAMSDKNITHQMVLDDLGKTVDNWGTKFNKLNDPSSSNKLVDSLTKVQLRANQASKATAASAVNTSKMKETFDKAAGSSKKVADNTEKLRREAERAAEEVRRIVYEYSTGEDKKRLDLEKEISHLRKYGMEQYVALAQARHQEEAKLIKMKFEYDLVEHRLTEEQKLRFSSNIKEQEIKADAELTKEQRNLKLDSLNDQFNQELALIKLSQETRLFQMREALMSETAAMQERYRLEREQILLNSKLSQEQKQREIALSKALQEEENRKRLNNAVQQWGSINAELTGTTDQFNLEKERFDRLDKSQALFDAELAMAAENYALKEQAYQAHVDRMSAIENAYSVSSLQLQLGYGQQMASSMSSMMGAIFGEKSKAYAAAFAVEKAFAVAQAAIAMGQNIAQASAIGFPQNIPMIAGAMAQGAQIASIIASVAAPTGYSDGGFTGTGGKFDPAGIVHKGEVVWSQEDIKRWGGVNVVEAMRTSQPPKGYSDGGLVTPQDTYRVGMGTVDTINRNADVLAERQAQASAQAQSANPQPIENNLRVIFVRDENEAKEMLYGPDGEKAFLYHQKRNKSKLA
ncbi:hypothetical protein [Acinetobacter johnsonii]|uniref:hypothetical protein n=1 Tax=Acinetobacter johnsonii TaxID=40214 RepID=UPI001F1B5A4B|nr:hypothetical protein [Acinetobacter johnsonii]UIZ98227.1 hypothetical protein GBN68_09940 [Acinetobacter johnsonii]